MTNLFLGFLNRSLSAAVLIFAVVLVRLVFKKAPKWLLCALWALAAVRLLCPLSIESVLSLIPSAEPVQPEIVYSAAPAITSGIPAVDAIVNPPLQAAFTPDPVQSANPLQILTWLAAWVWLGGCAVLILYAAISALRLRLRVRTAVRLEGNVFQSEFVPSPFILGVIRPRIYLPFGLEPGAQDMVLAHERAHLKRGDQLWKPLGFLLLTAYWFNPVCWLAYVLFCRDIEAACDEKVVRELGESCKTAYSRALLQCSVPRRMITACPLAFGETGVKGRIKSVLNYKKPAFWVVLAAVFVSIAVAVCFLTDPKTDTEQPEEEPPASSTADSPAEADSTPPTSAFFSSIEDYAEYYIAQVILPEPIEYKVLTDGGFETVTDTVQDAQMVNLEQLASLSGLDPEGDLQLWSYKIAIAPENADGRTFMLGTDTGLSYIDGQEYLVDNTRYLVTVTYRSETQDYRLLGWTKDTDGTALAVYEQSGRLTDYLRDIYAATHGANNIQGYFYPSFYNGMDGYGRAVHIALEAFGHAQDVDGGHLVLIANRVLAERAERDVHVVVLAVLGEVDGEVGIAGVIDVAAGRLEQIVDGLVVHVRRALAGQLLAVRALRVSGDDAGAVKRVERDNLDILDLDVVPGLHDNAALGRNAPLDPGLNRLLWADEGNRDRIAVFVCGCHAAVDDMGGPFRAHVILMIMCG